jgi:hypothetical protein
VAEASSLFAIPISSSAKNYTNRMLLTVGTFLILVLGIVGGNIGSTTNNSYLIKAYGQTDNSPAFQDSYWTDNLSSIPGARQTKVEVGPGEGSSTLAIVLVNKARQDITGVKGSLTLPDGFEAVSSIKNRPGDTLTNTTGAGIGPDGQIAEASLRSIVKAGDTFTLYFDVNVLDGAKVRQYSTNLRLLYSKVLDLGNLEINIPIQFRVPGKVILDSNIVSTAPLIPGTINKVPISIKNIGSANANGIVVTIKDISRGNTSSSGSLSTSSDIASSSSVNLGSTTFNLGTLAQNESKKINPIIYPGFEGSGKVQNLNLQISYGDAYGNRKQVNSLVGLVVAPKPPESVITVKTITNASGVNSNLRGLGATSLVSNSIYSIKQNIDNRNVLIVTAGQIQDLKFVISNNSSSLVSNLVMTLNSPLDSVKIVGDSKWTLNSLRPQTQQMFDTKVFAAKSVVGSPMLFNLGLNYIFNGDTKTDTLNLGAYVTGQFKIRAYDFNITDIGGVPNLVANLLNEGNSLAMFTTVEMVNDSSQSKKLVNSLPPSQYLGDLDENSPLPVTIPLDISKNSHAGSYLVSLRVTYKDDLRIEHSAILNGTVLYQPKVQGETGSGGLFGPKVNTTALVPAVIVVIVAAAVSLMIVRRRRRSRRLKTQLEGSESEDLALDTTSSFAAGGIEPHEEEIKKEKKDRSNLQK